MASSPTPLCSNLRRTGNIRASRSEINIRGIPLSLITTALLLVSLAPRGALILSTVPLGGKTFGHGAKIAVLPLGFYLGCRVSFPSAYPAPLFNTCFNYSMAVSRDSGHISVSPIYALGFSLWGEKTFYIQCGFFYPQWHPSENT